MHETNLSRIDLNLLVVFDAVARNHSVTKAAESLSLSQPAVSHALARLRVLIDDPLFVRGRGGLNMTPRAEELVQPIRDILGSISRVLNSPAFAPEQSTRKFRVAASDYAVMTVIPGLVRLMRSHAPNTRLEVLNVGADTLDQLETGDVDIAFWGATPPGNPYSATELFREHFVGVLCARHPLATKAGQGKATLDDFLAFPHVMVTFSDPRKSPIDIELARVHRTRVIAVTTPNFASNVASITGTDLIMSLPARLAKASLKNDLIPFELPLRVPDYPYSIVWHRRVDSDPAISWIRELTVTSTAQDEPIEA